MKNIFEETRLMRATSLQTTTYGDKVVSTITLKNCKRDPIGDLTLQFESMKHPSLDSAFRAADYIEVTITIKNPGETKS